MRMSPPKITTVSACVAIALTNLSLHARQPLPHLCVSENHRELVTAEGKPFIYLGDTAWELFHRLSREETEFYLKDRASKGFNVIQAVAIAEFGGLIEPNREGQTPLTDNDPTKPRDEYFQHIDFVVKRAAKLGIYTGILPTWGDKVNKKWGEGPEIFTPENARVYGEWIGHRYKDQPIIWILGGDRPIQNERHRLVFRAMAEGIRAAVGSSQLITYHPMGGHSSSDYVHEESWLDFNMMQSGHGTRNASNWKMIARDLALTPPKPAMDGEPAYEDHPVRSDKTKTQWFDDWDVRKLCYWGLFAGACGHTYGTHSIWSMWDGKGKKLADQRTPWREALKLPGSAQVGYARRLLESRPLAGRVADQSLLASDLNHGAEHCQAIRGADGSWAMIYSASGKPFSVLLDKFNARKLKPWWWDPRKGESMAGEPFENKREPLEFLPPESGERMDWVLVLDDVAKNYPPPGTR
jgi:hypothetical protein